MKVKEAKAKRVEEKVHHVAVWVEAKQQRATAREEAVRVKVALAVATKAKGKGKAVAVADTPIMPPKRQQQVEKIFAIDI